MAHKFKLSGMQNILNGFLRYRATLKGELQPKFESAAVNPEPQNLLITCVDSRIVASRVVQTNPGETLLTRNPGNLIPDYSKLHPNTPRPEEASLEIACLHNHVDSIALCGHSDCKAMNLVYENRKNLNDKGGSVLKSWLLSNAGPSVAKFIDFENSDFKKKLSFNLTDQKKFEAYIDPENEFAPHDKFSLVNTLTQLENLKNFKFVKDLIDQNKLTIHAMWLDIYTGDVYTFSYQEKRFIKLNETTYELLARDSI